MIENINDKINTQINEFVYKLQDYDDFTKRIEHEIYHFENNVVEELRETKYKFHEILNSLKEINKELRKLNGEEIPEDDELPF